MSSFAEQLSFTVSKYLFGDASKENIIEIPQGQLYIVRPRSPKGYSELIFKDAAASIRRTGQEFNYQIIVQRAYEEGEAELLEEEGGEDGTGSYNPDKDERSFLLDESLHFRADLRDDGEIVFAWQDLNGDEGDLYEFVCDQSVKPETATSFSLVAAQCQFERKYRTSHTKATEDDLKEFEFEDDEAIPQASPVPSPRISQSPPRHRSNSLANTSAKREIGMVRETPRKETPKREKAPLRSYEEKPTIAPPAVQKQITGGEILANEEAELHLFDFQSGTFVQQDEHITATVTDIGKWNYWLQITGKTKQWLGQDIGPDLNPVFNFEYLSFIFNHYAEDGAAYSWLLRFKEKEIEERFQEGLMQALWEHSNETKWLKAKENERDYVLDAFNDLVLEDDREREAREEDETAEDEEDIYEDADDGQKSEHYDEDESDDDVEIRDKDGNVNSLLAVGAKHDRSFVVRGSKIGVFKHTPENHLEFSTNISKVQTPNGKLFSPKKVMLHAGDRNMILQNEDDPNSLYRMDLEYGKVVDEWKVHSDIPITSFAPENVSQSCHCS